MRRPVDDDTPSIPVFWFVVSSVIHAILIAGSNTTLWSSHFRSWSTLSQNPSEALPELLARSEDFFAAAALIVGVVLGVMATKRLARGEYRPVLIRVAILVFVPILVESSTFGVQDGSPQDLNLIAPHSVALLIGLPLGALAASAIDLYRLRRPFER